MRASVNASVGEVMSKGRIADGAGHSMASSIRIDTNLDKVRESIAALGRQYPFAAARVVTTLANEVRNGLRGEMAYVFDRPTRYTLSAFTTIMGTKDSPVATVRHKDIWSRNRYLEAETIGIGDGTRRKTKTEERLDAIYGGNLDAIIPADNARIDGHGNWAYGERNVVLSALRAQGDSFANSTARSAARRASRMARAGKTAGTYFIPQHDPTAPGEGLAPGVYERRGKQLRIILGFLTRGRPRYRPRFDFFGTAHEIVLHRTGAVWREVTRTLQAQAR